MLAHHWVFLVSLGFVVASCANFAWLTWRHLLTSGPSDVRAWTIRILLIVPLYSIESWLALVLRAGDFNKVLALLRKGYECVVVLSFVELLLAWLGGPEVLAERLQSDCCRHLPPLSFVLPSWAPAPRFVRRTLIGVLQNALCSSVAIAVVSASWLASGRSPRVFAVAQVCCHIVMSASQFFAVYSVIIFYHANKGPLAPLRPVQKLLAIKGLVFCLFWQEAAIRAAEHAGAFDRWTTSPEHWSVQEVAWGMLNCVICVEMFLLSLLHARVYPPGEAARLRRLADVCRADTDTSALGLLAEDGVRPIGRDGADKGARPAAGGAAVAPGQTLVGGPCPTSGPRSRSTTAGAAGAGASGGAEPGGPVLGSRAAPAQGPASGQAAPSADTPGTPPAGALCEAYEFPPPSECWAGCDDEPPLIGGESGRLAWRRLLSALDLSDIPRRFRRHLHGVSVARRAARRTRDCAGVSPACSGDEAGGEAGAPVRPTVSGGGAAAYIRSRSMSAVTGE